MGNSEARSPSYSLNSGSFQIRHLSSLSETSLYQKMRFRSFRDNSFRAERDFPEQRQSFGVDEEVVDRLKNFETKRERDFSKVGRKRIMSS